MESLGIDLKLLIAQLVNFILFFYIFKRYIAKPFSQFLKTELDKEKEKERILQEIKKKEEMFTLEEKRIKEKIKKEYEEALKNTKQEAMKVREKIITQAKKDAEEIILKARRQIEEERNEMLKEIKQKAIDLSLLIVEKTLSQFIDKEMHKKINQQILKNFIKRAD